jgi:hypothetical protein
MRALIGVGAAMLIAVAIGVWSNAASRSTANTAVAKATLVPSIPPVSKDTLISISQIHNQAHLENLPVQEVDDQTFVFTAEHVATK